MTVTQVYVLYKAPHLTADQFKHHYETSHAPLVRELVGDKAELPLLYKRHYVVKQGDAPPAPGVASVDFDAITTLVFRDQAAADKFAEVITRPGNKERAEADSAKFLDLSRGGAVLVETSEKF
ncbi:hypothetical protein Z517_09597 [Fonsecaea pedrosoi CBS 271.37]|uniref:EthD domain-containing protein n=1 Tax=Fonsecaea pedrosoi CBS 271.37 TaxID=1442368 RepID=A0A0D2DHJ4_9EURO|nr:uncharacterized protein Z517_09597 [Fonsecaea pedrosoi CBS 271.37]KIW77151.1 hypothetical protein Z517_09597 [Fonsecaea pedrosoi CBS 271.37]